MNYFDQTPRAQRIALALAALGSRVNDRLEVAAAMDAELTNFPYLPVKQVLEGFVEQHRIVPGLSTDHVTGQLQTSDTDVAAYVAEWLERTDH